MSSERVALVTGGGRGIGASIARLLAGDGWSVVVAARTLSEVEVVAAEVGGMPDLGEGARAEAEDPGGDGAAEVTARDSVEQAVAEAGDVELLVANAGAPPRGPRELSTWEREVDDWWSAFEVNVLGVHLCCRAVVPGMLERGAGRIVITGSGASYLPGTSETGYSASKAAVGRYAENLANELDGRIPVFVFSPGLVRTAMTDSFGDDLPWTPPELAPELVRVLASGRADALAGRYIHAEHDDIEDLIRRADEIRERDLNAIRIQR